MTDDEAEGLMREAEAAFGAADVERIYTWPEETQ